jgi:hypothetical protein
VPREKARAGPSALRPEPDEAQHKEFDALKAREGDRDATDLRKDASFSLHLDQGRRALEEKKHADAIAALKEAAALRPDDRCQGTRTVAAISTGGTSMKDRSLKWLAGIVAVGLVLRLLPLVGNWHHPALFMGPDSWGNLGKWGCKLPHARLPSSFTITADLPKTVRHGAISTGGTSMKDRSLKWLAGIMAVGLVLRLLPLVGNWHHPALFMGPDSWGYQALAENLLAGRGYTWDERPPYTPNVYRPPGMPVLLAVLYHFTGVAVQHAILLQLAFSTLTLGITYWLVRVLGFPTTTALTAAALLAVDPVTIYYSNLLLTEVYSALMAVLGLVLASRYLQSGQHRFLVGLALMLAVGIIIHPILVLFPFLLVFLPLFAAKCRSVRHVGVAALAVVLVLIPAALWTVRNHWVADYRGISCVSSVSLLKYKAAGVMAELNGTTREQERDRLTRLCQESLPPDATPGKRWRAWERQGVAIIREYPLVYAKVHLKGMALELFGPERDHFTRFSYGASGAAVIDANGRVSDDRLHAVRAGSPVAAAELLRPLVLAIEGLIALLWLAGISSLVRARRWLLLGGLLLPAVYVLALSGGPEGSPRFRVIYTPSLCVLGGIALQVLRERVRFPGVGVLVWAAGRGGASMAGDGTRSTRSEGLTGARGGAERVCHVQGTGSPSPLDGIATNLRGQR